jgi:hypothetical protein
MVYEGKGNPGRQVTPTLKVGDIQISLHFTSLFQTVTSHSFLIIELIKLFNVEEKGQKQMARGSNPFMSPQCMIMSPRFG